MIDLTAQVKALREALISCRGRATVIRQKIQFIDSCVADEFRSGYTESEKATVDYCLDRMLALGEEAREIQRAIDALSKYCE